MTTPEILKPVVSVLINQHGLGIREAVDLLTPVAKELQRLEKENERLRRICYSCEYCGYEPKLD